MIGLGAFKYKEVDAAERVMQIAAEELLCLQQNIYFEAGNQGDLGKRAVAWVTLNRMDDSKYPNTICEVVWQHKQFSWTLEEKEGVDTENPIERKAWSVSGEIAKSVLFNYHIGIHSPVGGSIMFHADYVTPYWADSYKKVVTIYDHIFYERKPL
jgi:spore germination cell wall hydrolase CwlJ-like protein